MAARKKSEPKVYLTPAEFKRTVKSAGVELSAYAGGGAVFVAGLIRLDEAGQNRLGRTYLSFNEAASLVANQYHSAVVQHPTVVHSVEFAAAALVLTGLYSFFRGRINEARAEKASCNNFG